MVNPGAQLGGPVLSLPRHRPAQLVTGQRRSGGQRSLPGRPEGGGAAEEADGESDVSRRRAEGCVWATGRERLHPQDDKWI